MELIEAIKTRRSIRKYTDKDVSDDLIENIIKAGMMAPSAGNQQTWHFIVVRDREKMKKIPDFHPNALMLKKASLSIAVCGDP